MRLKNLDGRLVRKSIKGCLIDWDGKSRSKMQFTVKQFLKKFWANHICYEEFPVFGTRMKVDIINLTKKIAVEINGAQHGNFNPFFHNKSRANYGESIKRDLLKFKWLELNDFKVLNIEVLDMEHLSYKYIEQKFGISLI